MASGDQVGALLRRDDGRVLLGLRGPDHGERPGRWDIFGGPVQAGESIADALSRELVAQLGVHPLTARPLAVIEGGQGRSDIFVLEAWNGEPALVGGGFIATRWFTLAEAAGLPALAFEDYRRMISTLATGG